MNPLGLCAFVAIIEKVHITKIVAHPPCTKNSQIKEKMCI
jgi:hypothetical protein